MAANKNQKKTQIKTIEWPYQKYPNINQKFQPQIKETCADKCTRFKRTIMEQTCDTGQNYNCSCLNDSMKQKMCRDPKSKPVAYLRPCQTPKGKSTDSSNKVQKIETLKQNAHKEVRPKRVFVIFTHNLDTGRTG